MSNHDLPPEHQARLRKENLITEAEVAVVEGDLVIAKNVLTQTRRILGNRTEILNESQRRILKG